MSSMERIANQEITDKRQKKIEKKKEAGQKGLVARFLLGIRFWIERLFTGKSAAVPGLEIFKPSASAAEGSLLSAKKQAVIAD